ncbi:MAG: hypothetical protein WC312_03880 [Candidatus Omnitrophota bacterium]|jgi:uncharacterized protein HemX
MALTTATALLIAAGAVATAGVGTSVYQASEEKKAQKKALSAQEEQQNRLLSYQEAQVKAAEEKSAAAEALAESEAKEKIKKRRLSQTQTILTSPLGIGEEASLGFNTLLGG